MDVMKKFRHFSMLYLLSAVVHKCALITSFAWPIPSSRITGRCFPRSYRPRHVVPIRGGATGSRSFAFTGARSEFISAQNRQLSLNLKAKEYLPIAGSTNLKVFGGLKYRESSNEHRIIFVLGGPGAGELATDNLGINQFRF